MNEGVVCRLRLQLILDPEEANRIQAVTTSMEYHLRTKIGTQPFSRFHFQLYHVIVLLLFPSHGAERGRSVLVGVELGWSL